MKYIIIILFALSVTSAHGQRKVKEIDPQAEAQKQEANKHESVNWKDKLLYGGNLWMQFGTAHSVFIVQPQVAYRLTENTLTGVGLNYVYWKQTYQLLNGPVSFDDHMYGLNLFARQNIIKPVFAYAEYAPTNFTSFNSFGETKRVWGNALNIGFGLSQSYNGSGGYFILLYDVLWKQFYNTNDPSQFATSLRASPWDIRLGFFF